MLKTMKGAKRQASKCIKESPLGKFCILPQLSTLEGKLSFVINFYN